MKESSRRAPAGPQPLLLEALEERWMPAVIGGVIHEDCNANGIYESSILGSNGQITGEAGIGGVMLQLLDSSNQVVSTTVTDGQGRYQFSQRDNISTAPQEQVIDLAFDPAKTNHDRTDSFAQFNPLDGQLQSVTIEVNGSIFSQVMLENLEDTAAEIDTEVKGSVEFHVPGAIPLVSNIDGQIGATLGAFDGTADMQGSSARDFGTTELKGATASATITDPAALAAYIGQGRVSVTESGDASSCTCGTGNLLAMVRSMAGGSVKVVYRYTPSNTIDPGQYTIIESQPGGFLDGLETSDNLTAIAGSGSTDQITVNVASRSDVLMSNHFGEMREAALSGRVYDDLDNNGSFTNGSDGNLVGVTIQLTGTDALGRSVTRSTETGGDGAYRFRDLMAGNYTLTEIQPAGYQQGTNTVGSLGGDLSGDSTTVNVSCGQDGFDYNFGERSTPNPPPPPLIVPPPTPIVTPPPMITPPLPPAPAPMPMPFASKFFFIGRSWLDMM